MTQELQLVSDFGDADTLKALRTWLNERYEAEVEDVKNLIGKKVTVSRGDGTRHVPQAHHKGATVTNVIIELTDRPVFKFTVDCTGPIVEVYHRDRITLEDYQPDDVTQFRQAAASSPHVTVDPRLSLGRRVRIVNSVYSPNLFLQSGTITCVWDTSSDGQVTLDLKLDNGKTVSGIRPKDVTWL